MSQLIIIPENLLATSYGQAVAGSEADATMAAANLENEVEGGTVVTFARENNAMDAD